MHTHTRRRFGALALALVAAGALPACGPKNSPEGIAAAFLERIYKGDADGAIELAHLPASGKADQDERHLDRLKSHIARARQAADQAGGLKSVEIQSSKANPRDPNRAIVQALVHFAQRQRQERVPLILINGQWKIFL